MAGKQWAPRYNRYGDGRFLPQLGQDHLCGTTVAHGVAFKIKIRIQYAGSHIQQFRLNKGRKERRGRREAITRLRVKLPGEVEVEVEAPKRSRRRHNDSPHRHSLANNLKG
jgi:hypothetical protein